MPEPAEPTIPERLLSVQGTPTVRSDDVLLAADGDAGLLFGVPTSAELVQSKPTIWDCLVDPSGCGMERHVLERVFEPCFTTRSEGNWG